MDPVTARQQKPHLSFEFGIKQLLAYIVMFGVLFLLPVMLVGWLNDPAAAPWAGQNSFSAGNGAGGQVLAAATDNSGRYQLLPLLNFPFDTEMRDPATISFTLGVVLLLLAIVIIAIFYNDFRKREQKYASE